MGDGPVGKADSTVESKTDRNSAGDLFEASDRGDWEMVVSRRKKRLEGQGCTADGGLQGVQGGSVRGKQDSNEISESILKSLHCGAIEGAPTRTIMWERDVMDEEKEDMSNV